MKIAVIGCTHAGTAAVVNAKQLYPDSEITVYERNDNISFLSCGIALSVSNVVNEPEKLFYNSPENLNNLGINMRMNYDVTDIDMDEKIITATNLKTADIVKEKYDKLILTLGSWPIVPNFEGRNLKNILLCKNYTHAKTIIEKSADAKNVTVVMKGKNVTLVDAEDRIMSKYLDKEFTDIAENEFKNRGVKLALGEKVQRFEGENGIVSKVVTDKGSHEADLVVLCIGFIPSTSLVKGKLDTLPNGAIIIDEYMRTSVKDVFAAGDCCVVEYNPARDKRYIPLATNAVRMGTLVAKNLVNPTLKYMGTQGTSGIKIYDKCIASTGLTEEVAKKTTSMEIDSVMVSENHRPEFMPTYKEATIKLVYDKATRRILGGQIISDEDLTQHMNTLSVVIQNNMTIEELAMTDFFFQPHFNKPWSLLNTVALKALK